MYKAYKIQETSRYLTIKGRFALFCPLVYKIRTYYNSLTIRFLYLKQFITYVHDKPSF